MDELLRELAVIEANSPILCNYNKTLALLRALKAGTVSLDNVTMIADGWTVAEVVVEPPVEPIEDAAEPPEEVEPEIPDRLPVDPNNIVAALP